MQLVIAIKSSYKPKALPFSFHFAVHHYLLITVSVKKQFIEWLKEH